MICHYSGSSHLTPVHVFTLWHPQYAFTASPILYPTHAAFFYWAFLFLSTYLLYMCSFSIYFLNNHKIYIDTTGQGSGLSFELINVLEAVFISFGFHCPR